MTTLLLDSKAYHRVDDQLKELTRLCGCYVGDLENAVSGMKASKLLAEQSGQYVPLVEEAKINEMETRLKSAKRTYEEYGSEGL